MTYGKEVFLHEELRQDAVIRNFEVIGEEASHALSLGFKHLKGRMD